MGICLPPSTHNNPSLFKNGGKLGICPPPSTHSNPSLFKNGGKLGFCSPSSTHNSPSLFKNSGKLGCTPLPITHNNTALYLCYPVLIVCIDPTKFICRIPRSCRSIQPYACLNYNSQAKSRVCTGLPPSATVPMTYRAEVQTSVLP